MHKVEVSVIILAHQKNNRLSEVVQSVSWAAEVLLITTAQAFTLPGVTRQLTYPEPLISFSEARNWALQQATHDWVFFVDSDEVVAPSAASILSPLLSQTHLAGMYVTRQDIFLNRALQGGEAQLELLRVMRKNVAHFEGKVHETALVEGSVMHTPIKLYHYSHYSISGFLQKISWYAEAVALERQAKGGQFQWPELLLFPTGKFIWNYGVKLGFRDGWRGVIYALLMSIHSAAVRIFLYEKNL